MRAPASKHLSTINVRFRVKPPASHLGTTSASIYRFAYVRPYSNVYWRDREFGFYELEQFRNNFKQCLKFYSAQLTIEDRMNSKKKWNSSVKRFLN